MMTYHSNLIKPFDIFYAQIHTISGEKKKHYYVCIYSQPYDFNNPLENDILGLVITTNKKYENIRYNDYNAEINIGNKKSFVCCDKILRIPLKLVEKKNFFLTEQEREDIKNKFTHFNQELLRQLQIKEKIL